MEIWLQKCYPHQQDGTFKYTVMCHLLNAGEIYNELRTNKYFKTVAKFRYLGMTVINKITLNSIFNSGNMFYHSVQTTFSSCLLALNIKIKISKITILPILLHGCETSFLILWEEHTECV